MKTKTIISLLLLTCYYSVNGQTMLNKPWLDTSNAIILDPYSGNNYNLELVVKNTRVKGIIHKASQGLVKDSEYLKRKKEAKEKGLLWGSYHLGMPMNATKQADFYLSTIGDYDKDLLALDLEAPHSKKFMNIDSGLVFINRIYEKTGRYPVIYANQLVVQAISRKFGNNSSYSKCKLWYARFKNNLKQSEFNNLTWNKYVIRQFACEINCCECKKDTLNNCIKDKNGIIKYTKQTNISKCPLRIEGTECDIDINVYIGNFEKLNDFWFK